MDVARRDRVLQYPDLAKRLAAALQLTDPATWNGWIPPRTEPEQACSPRCGRDHPCGRDHYARANTSWIRAELLAIDAEALRRERAQLADPVEQAGDASQ